MLTLIKDIFEIQEKFSDVYIGGSVSLILQNTIPPRIPKDVDLVTPNNQIKLSEIFNSNKPKLKLCVYNNQKYELFYNPKAEFIMVNYLGYEIKVSPIYEMIDWKIRYFKRNPNCEKTNKDLDILLGVKYEE